MASVPALPHRVRVAPINGQANAGAHENPITIYVAGYKAQAFGDSRLAKLDLDVLAVDGVIGRPATFGVEVEKDAKVACSGFTTFFQQQCGERTARGKLAGTIRTLMWDGTGIE